MPNRIKYKYDSDVAELLKDVVEAFDNGEIDSIMICFRKTNDDVWAGWGNMSSFERLGVLKYMENDAYTRINKED